MHFDTSVSLWNILGIPGITVASIGAAAAGRQWCRRLIGRRKGLRDDLYRLGCGATFDYIESILGPACVGLRYKVRYLDPDVNERSKSFPDKQKKRGEDFLTGVESDKREGKYVDPRAGRVSFKSVAERWLEAQTVDYATRERVKSRIATHLVPFFEGKSIGAIKPSDVQAWLRWLQEREVGTNSRVLYFTHLVSILSFREGRQAHRHEPSAVQERHSPA